MVDASDILPPSEIEAASACYREHVATDIAGPAWGTVGVGCAGHMWGRDEIVRRARCKARLLAEAVALRAPEVE